MISLFIQINIDKKLGKREEKGREINIWIDFP